MIKPKCKLWGPVRTADSKKTFLKRDTTDWLYMFFKITEIIIHTIPIYRIDDLPERHNEALLKETKLTLKYNDSVMKKLNIT